MTSFAQAKQAFLHALEAPEHRFADTLAFIEQWYHYQPSAFSFDGLASTLEQNQGSCKIFALAQLLNLSQQQTLQCFGEHYRNLNSATAPLHANLNKLAKQPLSNLEFSQFPLIPKDNT